MSNTEKNHFRAIVRADLLLRAQSCVSHEETRYYLNGVHIEPCDKGGVLIVSTDGLRLICLRDEKGFVEGGTAIVSSDKEFLNIVKRVVANPKRFCKSALSYLAVVVDGKRMGLVETEGLEPTHDMLFDSLDKHDKFLHAIQWKDTIIDGRFPAWRKVVPNPESLKPEGRHGVINVRILAPLVEALSGGMLSAPAPRITPSQDEGSGPHLVRVKNHEVDGFGIIMPMRSDSPETLPDWMIPPAPPVEEPKAEEPAARAPEPAAKKPSARKRPAPKKRPAARRAAPRKAATKKAAPKKAAKKKAGAR